MVNRLSIRFKAFMSRPFASLENAMSLFSYKFSISSTSNANHVRKLLRQAQNELEDIEKKIGKNIQPSVLKGDVVGLKNAFETIEVDMEEFIINKFVLAQINMNAIFLDEFVEINKDLKMFKEEKVQILRYLEKMDPQHFREVREKLEKMQMQIVEIDNNMVNTSTKIRNFLIDVTADRTNVFRNFSAKFGNAMKMDWQKHRELSIYGDHLKNDMKEIKYLIKTMRENIDKIHDVLKDSRKSDRPDLRLLNDQIELLKTKIDRLSEKVKKELLEEESAGVIIFKDFFFVQDKVSGIIDQIIYKLETEKGLPKAEGDKISQSVKSPIRAMILTKVQDLVARQGAMLEKQKAGQAQAKRG